MQHINNGYFRSSHLDVICGPMKCGKSFEVIARLKKLDYAPEIPYQLFAPALDTRDAVNSVVRSRNGLSIPATVIDEKRVGDFLAKLNPKTLVVAFDEAQFLSKEYLYVIDRLIREGKYVVVSGLDLDFRGEPFGIMAELLARADKVTKLVAACEYQHPDGTRCKAGATRTFRLIDDKPAEYTSPVICVGDQEYSARCVEHHAVPGRPGSA